MQVFIPHYSQLADRRRRLEILLRKHGLDALWITEFDQGEVSEALAGSFVDISKREERAAVTGAFPLQDPLKKSEISLALKHLKIFRDMEDSPDGYRVIFEDDVQFLTRNFPRDFEKNLDRTPPDWDLIFFGSGADLFMERNPWKRQWNGLLGKTVYRRGHPATKCLDSYAISKTAARSLAAAVETIALPMDWELNYWIAALDLKVYWWEPALTTQGSQTGLYSSSVRP